MSSAEVATGALRVKIQRAKWLGAILLIRQRMQSRQRPTVSESIHRSADKLHGKNMRAYVSVFCICIADGAFQCDAVFYRFQVISLI